MTSLSSFVFADANVSLGVVIMVAGVVLLVIVLIALTLIEAAGEHAVNVQRRNHDS